MLTQLTILAPGLLGASLGQAAAERALARRVVVWARRRETRTACAEASWCDAAPESPEDAVADAELTVVCTPVNAIVPMIQELSGAFADDAVITDVGSTKGSICREAPRSLPAGRHFVGSHPMAGSEKSGLAHARPDLFVDRACFVTPTPSSHDEAVAKVEALWSGVGMRIIRQAPDDHDAIVAHLSHVPHLVASALCTGLREHPEAWQDLAGGGLRDTTRIAAGNPRMWREICQQNASAVSDALRDFRGALDQFASALETRDFDRLESLLEEGRDYRLRLESRS